MAGSKEQARRRDAVDAAVRPWRVRAEAAEADRLTALRDAVVAHQGRVQAQQALEDAGRICDSPGCLSAVIRNDDGSRRCAAGHGQRWVDVADLRKAEQALETIHDVLMGTAATVANSSPMGIDRAMAYLTEVMDKLPEYIRRRQLEHEEYFSELEDRAQKAQQDQAGLIAALRLVDEGRKALQVNGNSRSGLTDDRQQAAGEGR